MTTWTSLPDALAEIERLQKLLDSIRQYAADEVDCCDPYCCAIYLQNILDTIDGKEPK